ncbi:hypothetical protein BDQ17DRAFT_1333949 [Cyathus striatus]|nr:hypothetical protein BDQ17DRAFT_1333949 [Cyathus striatus]
MNTSPSYPFNDLLKHAYSTPPANSLASQSTAVEAKWKDKMRRGRRLLKLIGGYIVQRQGGLAGLKDVLGGEIKLEVGTKREGPDLAHLRDGPIPSSQVRELKWQEQRQHTVLHLVMHLIRTQGHTEGMSRANMGNDPIGLTLAYMHHDSRTIGQGKLPGHEDIKVSGKATIIPDLVVVGACI